MKKVVNAFLVFALLLSMVTPAFAQSYPDVEGTKYEDAVSTLSALGVLTGYNDGTFGPEDSITRAQFAAVAVRLLGLEDAARVSAGATPFSDPVPAWAQGYVNVAVQQEVITGYSDGRFGAQDNVTQAQAIAMLVRVLGYDPVVSENGWPTNYLVKASQLGLTKGFTVDGYQPATRGFVALLANNALYIDKMVQTGVTAGELNYAVDPGNTLLTNNLGYNKISGLVTDSYALLGTDLLEDEFKLNDGSTTEVYTFEEVEGLYGKNVTVWANSDYEVIKVVVNDTVLEADVVASTAGDGYVTSVTFDGDSEATDVASDAKVLFNYDESLTGYGTDSFAGLTVKYVLDGNGEISYLEVVDYTLSDYQIVVDSIDEEVINDKFGDDLTLTDDVYNIDLADLNEFDVVYAFSNPSESRYHLDVVSDIVAGDFSVKYSNGDFKIGGTRYSVNSSVGYSIDNGSSENSTVLYSDLIGNSVSAVLDVNGEVYFMFADLEVKQAPTNYMVVTNYTSSTSGLDEVTSYYVKALGQDNESAWYELTDDTVFYNSNGDTVTVDITFDTDSTEAVGVFEFMSANDIVDMLFAEDGTVASISLFDTSTYADENLATSDFINSRNLVSVDGRWYPVSSTAAFFDTVPATDAFVAWNDVSTTDNALVADVVIVDGEVTIIYVNSGTITTTESIQGVVVTAYENADGDIVFELNQEGTITSYVLADSVTINEREYSNAGLSLSGTPTDMEQMNEVVGDYVTVTLTNGEASTVSEGWFDEFSAVKVSKIGDLSIYDDSATPVAYYVDDEAVFYDVSASEPAFVSISDISKDDYVILDDTDNDGLYDIILIGDSSSFPVVPK